jgi:hypothetical protein
LRSNAKPNADGSKQREGRGRKAASQKQKQEFSSFRGFEKRHRFENILLKNFKIARNAGFNERESIKQSRDILLSKFQRLRIMNGD